jgi:hypothetical protein
MRFGSKGSIRSMSSKVWKYFPIIDIFYKKLRVLFQENFLSLLPSPLGEGLGKGVLCVFAPLRALRETKNV